MTGRSTAGVGLDPQRWLPQVCSDERVAPAIFCAAAGLAGHFDPDRQLAGAPVATIARRIGQHPDRLRDHLRQLTALGWTFVARPGARGRGRCALYRLDQPALLARPKTPSQEGILPPKTPSQEGIYARKTPSQEGILRSENTLAGGHFPPHTPRGGLDGLGTPDPLVPSAEQVTAATALIARFPIQLHAHDRRRRTALAVEVARLLEAGWPERDLFAIATHDLPVRVNNPARFVRSRFEGRRPPEHRAGRPLEEAWRQVVGPDPDRIRVGAAAARAALRGAS